MTNFADLNTDSRYTLPYIKGQGYYLTLVSKDERVRNDGTNMYFKSATFKSSGGSARMMDVLKGHVFNVTFNEDGDQFVADLLSEE